MTSDQMFRENDRLNSLLAIELMVETELHPGQPHQAGPELDRLPDQTRESPVCDLQVPGHELHLGEADPEQPDRAESVLSGRAQELHAGDSRDVEGEEEQEEHEEERDERPNAPLPLERRFTMDRLLHRAHVGMGHPSPDRFVHVLRYAKAKPEVIEAAKQLKCSVCQQHAQVRPARRSAPPKELSFNECIGVDVVLVSLGR